MYIVLGATHPESGPRAGRNVYRLSLERLGERPGRRQERHLLQPLCRAARADRVHRRRRHLSHALPGPAQITSGTLAYAFGCGKPVVSTPYWHAEELLADGRGVIVPFRDSAAIARELGNLLRHDHEREAMRRRAYGLGREMIWSHVAHLYMDSFQQARRTRIDRPVKAAGLSHARRATLGTAQVEARTSGADDRLDRFVAARQVHAAQFRRRLLHRRQCAALLFAMYLEEMGLDTPETQRATTRYAAFLDAAFDPTQRRFRNFLSFDRRWLHEEELGSDDCFGRALCAFGACIGRSKQRSLQSWAMELFQSRRG